MQGTPAEIKLNKEATANRTALLRMLAEERAKVKLSEALCLLAAKVDSAEAIPLALKAFERLIEDVNSLAPDIHPGKLRIASLRKLQEKAREAWLDLVAIDVRGPLKQAGR